jgi:hypothetical protein
MADFDDRHNRIAKAVAPHRGRELATQAVKKAYAVAYPKLPEEVPWVQPSDHCVNHKVKGCCGCSLTEGAIFEQLGRGLYLVR